MNTVELRGSYYEIGRGWNMEFKGKMDTVMQIELGMISGSYGISSDEVVELGKKYQPPAKLYDPDFIEVLSGFADGSEVDFDTLFAIRSALEILFFTGRPTGLCTSLAITGEATQDGETISSQNIDWHLDPTYGLAANCLAKRCKAAFAMAGRNLGVFSLGISVSIAIRGRCHLDRNSRRNS